MSLEVTMPQMGESVVEGTVTKWLVKEGDRVNEDQPLCEISTDKVDTEIPSPGSGIIARLLASEGQTLPVGAALAVIESGGATAQASARQPAPVERAAPVSGRVPQTPSAPTPPPAHARQQPADSASIVAQPRPQAPSDAAAPPSPPRRYSPVVIRMAEEHGIDLSLVPGTGIGGRVSKRDVERYLETLRSGQAPQSQTDGIQAPPAAPAIMSAPAPSATPSVFRPPVYQPRDGDTVEPFSRRRKLIAEHMVYSKTHAPHV
ncbi:MAG: E3 binding domain-containing protein, partial [Deltaproteobacteria bacterium]|nr:E3 binding domain-containing protein [Deltaproteobacteria bacterium]